LENHPFTINLKKMMHQLLMLYRKKQRIIQGKVSGRLSEDYDWKGNPGITNGFIEFIK
jgi:hypothetical protein